MTQAHPLQWPTGWPRARVRKRATFNQKVDNGRYTETKAVTIAVARDRLQRELDLLGAEYVTLSSNVELRIDGQPRSDRREPEDPGVAVYFRLGLSAKPIVLACDRWDRVADNITALAKHIEAMRGMERWGVGTAAQAFAGYEQLAAPEQWWDVLGVSPQANRAEIADAYRARARRAHPDQGGTNTAMSRLNAAREAALRYQGS